MCARSALLLATVALASVPATARTQALAARIASLESDVVSFYFTPRPGICGDGETYIRTGRSSYHGSFRTGRQMEPCEFGPVQVRLTVRDRVVDRVQFWVGRLRSREARDLGAVSAPEAAAYLMTLASHGNSRASAKAVFPAVLADSATVWPGLLVIARDTETRSRSTRQEATLWLSRFASGAVVGRPNDPFAMEDSGERDDDDEKSNAVFVLSQLPHGEGIPTLLDVARSNQSPRVRSQAFFWLGQSGDPRAIDLFEAELKATRPSR